MFDAAEKFMGELARPGGDESRWPATIVEMLMGRHRRNADDVAGFPRILRLLVHVVAFPFLHENHFLEDMPVLAGMPGGIDFRCHQIQSAGRDFGPEANVKF